jgi:hypothetical protein
MASNDFDTLEGQLEISSRPATLCYGKPWDFVARLVDILKVTFPVNRDNKFIVFGHQTPTSDDVNTMWARFDSSGNPLNWYAYVKGKWQIYYTVAPNEVRWFAGSSATPPNGWRPLLSTADGVSQGILDKLLPLYNEVTPGLYSYYAARYIGY